MLSSKSAVKEDQKTDSMLRELPRKIKHCLQLNFSSRSIDGLGLSIECLALRIFSIHCAETLDAQLLACTDYSGCPARYELVALLSMRILLLAHDLVPLVLHEVRTGLPRCSLLLVSSRASKKNFPQLIKLLYFE